MQLYQFRRRYALQTFYHKRNKISQLQNLSPKIYIRYRRPSETFFMFSFLLHILLKKTSMVWLFTATFCISTTQV